MQKHHGQIIERVVRKNGFSITELSRALKVNRRSIYNWFQSPKLKPDVIRTIGHTIRHDFSSEFEEFFNSEDFNDRIHTSDNTAIDNEFKEKYLRLLESYNELLLGAIEQLEVDRVRSHQ